MREACTRQFILDHDVDLSRQAENGEACGEAEGSGAPGSGSCRPRAGRGHAQGGGGGQERASRGTGSARARISNCAAKPVRLLLRAVSSTGKSSLH